MSNDDIPVQTASLFFEARMGVEIVGIGLARLMERPEAASVKRELQALRGFSDQTADALEGLQKAVQEALGIQVGPMGRA